MFSAGDSGSFLSSQCFLSEENIRCIICNARCPIEKRKNRATTDKYLRLLSGCLLFLSISSRLFLALSWSSLSEGLFFVGPLNGTHVGSVQWVLHPWHCLPNEKWPRRLSGASSLEPGPALLSNVKQTH